MPLVPSGCGRTMVVNEWDDVEFCSLVPWLRGYFPTAVESEFWGRVLRKYVTD